VIEVIGAEFEFAMGGGFRIAVHAPAVGKAGHVVADVSP